MEWWAILLLVSFVLLVLMFIGVPIAYSLGFLALTTGLWVVGPRILYLFGAIAYGKVNEYAIVALPLFIVMAELILVSDIARDGFEALTNWVGALPGGLAIASQIMCALFAALCGASSATTAVIGGISVPEMLKRGYEKRMATGSIAAGGALGVLIPPSILLIIYGVLTESSIGQLFMGGVIPGIILMLIRIVYFLVVCSVNPSLGPAIRGATWPARFKSFGKISPVLALIAFLFFALYSGMATPTELAGIGAFVALLIALAYRRLNWPNLKEAFYKTSRTTSFVLWILISAASFGYVMSYLQIPQKLCDWVLGLSTNPYVIIICINLLLIVLGCIMDAGAIIMVTVPILTPIVHALGFDLVWFGVMFVVNIELAEITPPMGLNLYVMKSVSPPDVTLNDIIIGSIPFMIIDIVVLAMVIIWPSIIMWLPMAMVG
jgi:tripartite ATP-independent transporter DctM subunit